MSDPQRAFVAHAACSIEWLAWVSTILVVGSVMGCTTPRPLDAGVEPDVPRIFSDVPRLDVPVGLDTPSALDAADALDAAPDAALDAPSVMPDVPPDARVDAGPDAPVDPALRCNTLWGREAGYELCGATATTCEVRVELLGRTCEQVCEARGGLCEVVHNDGAFFDVCMADPRDLPCSTTGLSYICTCRVP